jgi:hypothetical protein
VHGATRSPAGHTGRSQRVLRKLRARKETVGIMILGFWQFGWVLGSRADEMARDRANLAVAQALAPVCAAKFFAQPDSPAKLTELKKLTSEYA